MTAAFRKPATILVVEDDRATREALAAVLAGAGYTVLTAADGQEALDSFGVIVIPDLILLDMLMPRLDGWQFIAAFKQRLGRTPLPVLIATGTIVTAEWAADNHCCGFLHKPIDSQQLIAEVARCLGR